MNQHVVSLQFAIFFKDTILKPYSVFEDVNRSMLGIFDGPPQMIDLPPSLPADVPLMTLRSERNDYLCNISRSRIDLHISRVDEEKSNAEIFANFNSKTEGFVKYVLGKTEVQRFGMICRYFFPDSTPVRTICKKYMKASPEGLSELTIRFNTPGNFENLVVNDVVEINSAEAIINQRKQPGIFVQRDINNQPVPDTVIGLEQLGKISRSFSARVSESSIEGLLK